MLSRNSEQRSYFTTAWFVGSPLTYVLLCTILLAACAGRNRSAPPPPRPLVRSQPPAEPTNTSENRGTTQSQSYNDTEAELAWDFLARFDDTGVPTSEPPRAAVESVRDFPDSHDPTPSTGNEKLTSLPPIAHKANSASTGWLNWVPGISPDSSSADVISQYQTEEDLLKAVAEFQRLADKDTYRFPLPKDITGANVHKATLSRLLDYEARHPGAYPMIIAFTRGRAYEGLHAYDSAVAQFAKVSESTNRLQDKATTAVAALLEFKTLKNSTPNATTAVEYVNELEKQGTTWRSLAEQYSDTPYEGLALEEEEFLDRAKVTFLELNRYRIVDGNESVLLAYQQLLDKHHESKNRFRYRLELADFYVRLARDYVAQNDPETLRYDAEIFESLGSAALQHYAKISQEDGVIEKLEAQNKLGALQSYMARIKRLGY